MSSDIWTRCAGASELRPLRLDPWRVVEAQHLVSTRKLVDSDAEQALIEDLIETVKPPMPPGPAGRLHYLLFTPFRYPPLPHGSRFGTTTEPGIWYGAESVKGALAESAYYRLVFLEGTTADLGVLEAELTAYRVRLRTERGIDLASPPFDAFADRISSKTRYDASQGLGRAMREDGVEAFRYTSARDPDGGANVGAFVPAVFGRSKPRDLETWHSMAGRDGVEFRKRDYFRRVVLRFDRAVFLVRGKLPAPAV
jgi:hypothetical protein